MAKFQVPNLRNWCNKIFKCGFKFTSHRPVRSLQAPAKSRKLNTAGIVWSLDRFRCAPDWLRRLLSHQFMPFYDVLHMPLTADPRRTRRFQLSAVENNTIMAISRSRATRPTVLGQRFLRACCVIRRRGQTTRRSGLLAHAYGSD